MRIALVENPNSGSDDAPAASDLLHELGVSPAPTVALDRLDDVRAAAAAGRIDRLVVAGGDGSIGPVAELAAELGVPLAVVPAGTANDFARALALPSDVRAACELAINPTATQRGVDLAFWNDRPFLNVAGCGLSAPAAAQAEQLKPKLGALAYAAGALGAALRAEPMRCEISCDGQPSFHGSVWQVLVANSGAFGGGASIGAADTDNAQLDLAVLPCESRWSLARRAWGLRRGTITDQDGVTHQRVRELRVHTGKPTPWVVDGELLNPPDAIVVLRVQAAAFQLVTTPA